jgi:hypothetical protein
MKYKPSEYAFQTGNPVIAESIEKSRRERIHHYTNLDALLSILKTRTLKFNRIDNVNDQSEKLFINEQEIIDRVFLSCFTYRVSEYIPHWFMYSKDVYGIRLSFVKKERQLSTDSLIEYNEAVAAYKNGVKVDELCKANLTHDIASANKQWHVDFTSIDVIYDEKFAKENPVIRKIADDKNVVDLSALGTVKAEPWKFEDETRMIAHLRFYNDGVEPVEYDYLLVPIHFRNIEKVEITCGPWMTWTLKETVKELCAAYLDGVKFEVRSSRFEGIIRR